MKTVTFIRAAHKQLRSLRGETQTAIVAKLNAYAQTGAGDVTAMKGQDGARLRVGDYRAIFVETETTIEVRAVGHRRDIYR